MKIAIGINSFKEEKNLRNHEVMCVESLRRIKNKFTNVDLINITFENELINFNNFINLPVLKQNSDQVFNFKKKLPYVNELFDVLSNLDYDYFIFINNDIIVSDRFIKHIMNQTKYETFVASKLHFTKLDSLSDDASIPDAISVHGFDGFAIKSTWWKENRNKFEPFFLGKPYWDTYFFTMCYLHSKCKVLNKPPCSIFHVTHNSDAMEDDELNIFNQQSFSKDQNIPRIWFRYVYDVLLKRQEFNNIKWYIPFEKEEEFEKQFLKI
jgi:hypothetical protein